MPSSILVSALFIALFAGAFSLVKKVATLSESVTTLSKKIEKLVARPDDPELQKFLDPEFQRYLRKLDDEGYINLYNRIGKLEARLDKLPN